MSIQTKTKCSSEEHYKTVGQDWPFTRKPVINRRPLNPSAQESLDLYEFKDMTISKQSQNPLFPKKDNAAGSKEIPGFYYPSIDLQELQRKEIEMGRLLDAKKHMLMEKLVNFEEKVRLKLQSESVATNTGHDHKNKEECHNKIIWPPTRLSEHHRENRGDLSKERRQEDVKQLMKRQNQWNEDRTRISHDEGRDIWRKVEKEFKEGPQSTFKENKGAQYVAVNREKVNGELNNLRKQNVMEGTNLQRHKIYDYNGRGAVVKPDHGMKTTKGKELNELSIGHFSLTKDNKNKSFKPMYGFDTEPEMPQMTPKKTAHRTSTESHKGAESLNIFERSTLPPILNHSYSSAPQQGEQGLMESTDASFPRLPCRVCNRKFASERLEKHVRICETVNQSHRRVFNSYIHRTKGSAIEEYWRTHSRSKTPEDFKPNYKAYSKKRHQGRLQAVTPK